MNLVTRNIPIVVYNADGSKTPVGVMEVAEGDNLMIGTITDPRLKEIISNGVTAHLSFEEAVPTDEFGKTREAVRRAILGDNYEGATDPFGLTTRREERHLPDHDR